MILQRLKTSIEERLKPWAEDHGLQGGAFVLSSPPEHVAADASLPWPLAAAKLLKRKPLDVAGELADLLKRLPEAEAVEAAPPGFLNIRLSPGALGENLAAVLDPKAPYGSRSAGRPRNILVEFVSANPTGPVHLASGRAATLGDALVRILRRLGHRVHAEYYVNDVGRQVELLGLSVKARYENAPVPEEGYQGEYIKELAAEAPRASGWSAADFSDFAVGKMLAAHKRDIESFGVRFDRWFRESELHRARALDKALQKLKSLGRVQEKDGALWLGAAAESGEDKDRVLVRSDGRPTYFLADIAYHLDKLERGFTELIDIWGADHHGYVPRMKAAIAALGYPPETFHAIVHQLVHLFRGKEMVKMSKRAGEFITLRELVQEVGVDACRFFFALRSPNTHLNFDLELAKKQSAENPVYYVQYVHARIASIFREASGRKALARAPIGSIPKGGGLPLKEPAERTLLVKIAWFPETLAACEKEFSPHPLANYLLELAALFHPFYEKCRVVDESEPELSLARLALCAGVKAVIADGLGLLGVSAPERM